MYFTCFKTRIEWEQAFPMYACFLYIAAMLNIVVSWCVRMAFYFEAPVKRFPQRPVISRWRSFNAKKKRTAGFTVLTSVQHRILFSPLFYSGTGVLFLWSVLPECRFQELPDAMTGVDLADVFSARKNSSDSFFRFLFFRFLWRLPALLDASLSVWKTDYLEWFSRGVKLYAQFSVWRESDGETLQDPKGWLPDGSALCKGENKKWNTEV